LQALQGIVAGFGGGGIAQGLVGQQGQVGFFGNRKSVRESASLIADLGQKQGSRQPYLE